jgi:mono/diheme cytochrome c family protein
VRTNVQWALIIGGGVVVGLLLVACMALLFGIVAWVTAGGVGVSGSDLNLEESSVDNGRQIYFTATGQRGTPITSDIGMGMMRGGMMACATCHGADGRGGQVQMMMRVFEAPDIRYQTLISAEHGEEMEHEPYTDETIKQAITQGVEPDGEPLDWPMPRWSMSDQDLEDLLAFLKTLR